MARKRRVVEEPADLDPATGPADTEPYETDLAYIEEELQWVAARAEGVGASIELERLDGEPSRRSPFDEPLSPRTLAQRRTRLQAKEGRLRDRIDRRLDATRQAGRSVALDRLCEAHGLDAFERTVLLLAAGPCFANRFEQLYEQLDRDQRSAGLSVEAVFAFHELGFAERVERRATFGPRARLVASDLITVNFGSRSSPQDLLATGMELTGRTFGYLVGRGELSDELMEFSSVEEPRVRLDQVVLAPEDKARILAVVERHEDYLARRRDWGFDDIIRYGRGILMLFHGKPGTGKTMMAHGIAQQLGKRVLNVDIPTFVDSMEGGRFLPTLFREARMQNAVLFFDECEMLLASRRHGNALMTILLTEIERFEGVAIMATNLPDALDEALERRILVKVRFPEPDRAARAEIWRKHLPPTAPFAEDVDTDALAERYEVTGGYIKNAVLTAVAEAVHRGAPAITMEMLERAIRDQMRRPDDDARVATPATRLCDVVLPPALREQVEELISAARGRRTVLERWGIGRHFTWGKGVSAILWGPPGTGKTLCAEAIAGELSRPLLVASLPAVVSKWVGETEKNLERLFDKARELGAVLFIDEADALLMERGEGNASRHDDAAVNTLLTLIERHEGLVLLATNLADRLDRALSRRLTYRLRFPLPDAVQRTAIWRGLLPASVPVEGALDLELLGRRYELAGGLIKNAVLKAAFRAAAAGALTQAHLERAAEEELASALGGDKRVGFSASVV